MEIKIPGGRHLQRALVVPLLHSLRLHAARDGAGARLLMAQGNVRHKTVVTSLFSRKNST